MNASERVIQRIWKQEPKLEEYLQRNKLLAMLQSMSRKFPMMILWKRRGGFGVSTTAGTYLRIQFSSDLTDAQLYDLLELFAVYVRVDPASLRK